MGRKERRDNKKTCSVFFNMEIIHTYNIDHFKVQLFWEGHKNLCHRPYGFDIYLVNVKTMAMAQIFVAFSEKLNFK